jgi:hypothetical protein
MKYKVVPIFILIMGIFMSCKKVELSDIDNSAKSDVPLLSKILIDNQPYKEFTYANAKLISEEKSNFDYKFYQYSDKNLLIAADFYSNYDILSCDPQVFQTALNRKDWVTPGSGNKDGTIKYEYNNNAQLIKTTFTRTSSSISESSEFSYDANNRINRQTMYWDNIEIGYIEYSYDGKGNLIKENLYNLPSTGVADMSTTTQYEFDNGLNPFRSFSSLVTPGINTNLNNIIKETCTIHLASEGGADKVQVTGNSYEYNTIGYPASKNGNIMYVYK